MEEAVKIIKATTGFRLAELSVVQEFEAHLSEGYLDKGVKGENKRIFGKKPSVADTVFVRAVRSALIRRSLGIREKEALAYLVWAKGDVSLDEKITAWTLIGETEKCRGNESGCLYSPLRSLYSFLRAYCQCVSRIKRELTDSKHGMDFRWRIIGSDESIKYADGVSASSEQLSADCDPYGELDLCFGAVSKALDELPEGGAKSINITCQYWSAKDIQIRLIFSLDGLLVGLRSEPGFDDSCARLYALKKVEDEEATAYWVERRAIEQQLDSEIEEKIASEMKLWVKKAEEQAVHNKTPCGNEADNELSKAYKERMEKVRADLKKDYDKRLTARFQQMTHARINPFFEIRGKSRLEAMRDSYYLKYRGVIEAFDNVNLSLIEKNLESMDKALNVALKEAASEISNTSNS